MDDLKKSRNLAISRPSLLILIAATFSLGVFVGRGAWLFGPGRELGGEDLYRNRTEELRFIRQSLPQDTAPQARKIQELKPFRYKVDGLIGQEIAEGNASSVSVYFRDLNNGNWFGIREQELFSPEHQMKLPLMIAYFKRAETNPLVLRKKITIPSAMDDEREPRYLRPPKKLEPGKAYSVNELIFRMAAYGDNNAYALLAANLPLKYLRKIQTDLYVNYDPSKKEDALSLSAYASFFRVLFNASYLSEEMSDKALRYLSRSAFRGGMAAGLPPGVDLASKAGERVTSVAGQKRDGEQLQLHEFGIIYHPERPFLLGVTARGDDFDGLSAVIRDITRLVYAEVDRQLH
jgi:beta-lactamase class A